MHYCYLVKTPDKPDRLDTYDGVISELIEPYYYEYEPDYVFWDWCEIGGRWSGEIPDNCCQGKDIPDDFEPYGVISSWGVLDKGWHDDEFWNKYEEMTQEERMEGIKEHDDEAMENFAKYYEIDPEAWYTLVDFHS